jgi:serine/threonine protein kinase
MLPYLFEIPEIDSIAALLPTFEFDCCIAQGGMGAVYKARQRSLDRDVAIKILPRELGEDPLFRSSFQAEARAMARLSHPNLIRVFDSGDLDGLLYIVMEYVPGKSLYHSAHQRAVDARQAVELIIAVCNALAHAHENGIIHRDIKPANILLTPKCEPKIGDFGLARCTRTGDDGLAMGTPAYMAPEIVHHLERGDCQSDVFAIGVVLRELLTGIPAGSDRAAPSVVSDPVLAAICRKATHTDPASRYPDATSLPKPLVPVRKTPFPRPKPVLLAGPGAPPPAAPLRKFAVVAVLAFSSFLAWGFDSETSWAVSPAAVGAECPSIGSVAKGQLKVSEVPLSRGLDC